MSNQDAEATGRWVREYFIKYQQYMNKHHIELFQKFQKTNSVHPPSSIGAGIVIWKGAVHSDEDYNEIFRITHEFCIAYPNPEDIPDSQ